LDVSRSNNTGDRHGLEEETRATTILRGFLATAAGLICVALGAALWPAVAKVSFGRAPASAMDLAELIFTFSLGVAAGLAVSAIAHPRDYLSISVMFLVFAFITVVGLFMAMVESGESTAIRSNAVAGTLAMLGCALGVVICKVAWSRRVSSG
jgi:hypothetical protein